MLNPTTDEFLFYLLSKEEVAQKETLQMIASENFQSKQVRKVVGSVFGNRYSEGYPDKRYYGGQHQTDRLEELAINRITSLFKCKYANVQPHSGSQANAAAYMALLEPGDTVLAMSLDHGGHLTHGHGVNFSGSTYNFVHYGVDENGCIDLAEVERLALEHKPKLIVCGASAYSRKIFFRQFRLIADKVGAKLMADVAHIAGLIVTDLHPEPFPYCDIVTSTTHKTLRGARGGIILTNDEAIIKKVNSKIFPGTQGGPLMNQIAGKAVAFFEAEQPEFHYYMKNVLINSKVLSNTLKDRGFNLVGNGTDNHLVLVDLQSKNITGKEAQELLEYVGIICNKNTIPNDPQSPFVTSGIRLGTAALTTRGIKHPQMLYISNLIADAIENKDNKDELRKIKQQVAQLAISLPDFVWEKEETL